MKLVVNVDGGARGNPGPAAIAAVVQDAEGNVLEEHGERIGRATNNVAEYRALLLGIERAVALGADELDLVGDSELIVKQVKGEYKVKDATMRELHGKVKEALREVDSWSIRHVRREYNAEADRLVNRALDGEEDSPSRHSPPSGGVKVGSDAIDPGVDIGHVHLKVADLDRAVAFYRDVLGFELQQRVGEEAAFVSAGGYHHHIGLNTWQSKGGQPPAPGTTGLFHFAVRYPTRRSLAVALRRLIDQGIGLSGASDHGVSEALYLSDPDGNGIELYWDRPKEEWPEPAPGERVAMYSRPLDLEGLLAELRE